MSKKEFPTQQVLELACAAQRINGAYIKEDAPVYSEDGAFMYLKHTNKIQMLCTLEPAIWTADPKDAPMPLRVLPEDVALAEEIRKYFRKFLFSAIEGENDFQTNINTILSSDTVKQNQFGYVACLPSVHTRDIAQTKVKRAARAVEEGYLAEIGSAVKDLDAEIISSIKSKNFEGWNIDAIINNKMVSWLNKTNLNLGACVVVKAKIKDHTKHWKHQNDVTRLNYVKAAQ
jgi:Uri superfamily endonuclease